MEDCQNGNFFHLQITNMVAKLDMITGRIQKKLIESGLDQRVNVIHLSDHGMNSVIPPNFINLYEFVANTSCEMYGSSPVLQIVPTDSGYYSNRY